jgi:hypothetical protein
MGHTVRIVRDNICLLDQRFVSVKASNIFCHTSVRVRGGAGVGMLDLEMDG